MMEKPRRAHVLKIEFGANSLDDLIYALNQTAIDLRPPSELLHTAPADPVLVWSIWNKARQGAW